MADLPTGGRRSTLPTDSVDDTLGPYRRALLAAEDGISDFVVRSNLDSLTGSGELSKGRNWPVRPVEALLFVELAL